MSLTERIQNILPCVTKVGTECQLELPNGKVYKNPDILKCCEGFIQEERNGMNYIMVLNNTTSITRVVVLPIPVSG